MTMNISELYNHLMTMDAVAQCGARQPFYLALVLQGFQENMLSMLLFRMLIMYFLVLQIPTKQSSSN